MEKTSLSPMLWDLIHTLLCSLSLQMKSWLLKVFPWFSNSQEVCRPDGENKGIPDRPPYWSRRGEWQKGERERDGEAMGRGDRTVKPHRLVHQRRPG